MTYWENYSQKSIPQEKYSWPFVSMDFTSTYLTNCRLKILPPQKKNPRKFQEAKLDLPHTEHRTDSMRMKWCVSIPFWSLYANTMPFYVNGHPWIMVSAREEWGQGPWTNLPKIEKWLYKEVCLLKESKQNNTRQVYS